MKTQVLFLREEESNTGRDVEKILVDDSLLFSYSVSFHSPRLGAERIPL